MDRWSLRGGKGGKKKKKKGYVVKQKTFEKGHVTGGTCAGTGHRKSQGNFGGSGTKNRRGSSFGGGKGGGRFWLEKELPKQEQKRKNRKKNQVTYQILGVTAGPESVGFEGESP